jgi:hypothetical protein
MWLNIKDKCSHVWDVSLASVDDQCGKVWGREWGMSVVAKCGG